MINLVYTLENSKNTNSVFLAGPSLRWKDLKTYQSWRSNAISFLDRFGFDGDVYIPEHRNAEEINDNWTYSKQIDWEIKMLTQATVIMFWIPRDLDLLPGFTTNIEFGEWLRSGKIVIGAPHDAAKIDYIKERCNRLKIPWFDSLEDCAKATVNKVKELQGIKNKIWFTADTHFGSQRTLELSRRPFKNVDKMSWGIVDNWNSIVSKDDTVYHLGDFGDSKFIHHLYGKAIYLVPGNYDTSAVLGKIQEIQEDSRVTILHNNFPLQGTQYKLVHEPEFAKMESSKDFFLFGHIHQLQMIKRNGLNVGVDCHNFAPIDIETIEFYRNAIKKHYDKNVFMDLLGNN